MSEHRVTLVLSGHESDEVPATALVDQLHALLRALAASDREAFGRITTVWLVAILDRGNTAIIGLEPKSVVRRSTVTPGASADRFFDLLDAIQQGDVPERVRRSTLVAFRDLGKPVGSKQVNSLVRNQQREARIQPALTHMAEAAMAPTTEAIGSVEGRLQWINTHGDKLLMWIYPWVGPERIKCRFPADLINRAGESLDKWVRVHGVLKYPAHAVHPRLIDVDDIEDLPQLADVPTLASQRGSMPGATGPLTSDDWTRKLRDEW